MGKKKKKNNPHSLTLRERMTIVETDMKWLKKGYWLQVLISMGTFLSVLGLILQVAGVI